MNNEEDLIQLIDQFYKKSFSFNDCYNLFGSAKEKKGWQIILSPLNKLNLTEVILEKEGDNIETLAGISMKLKNPVSISFSKFGKLFGNEREMPAGTRPESPWSYQFMIKGKECEGYILLITPKPSKEATRLVQAVILRRFAQISPQAEEIKKLLEGAVTYNSKVKYAKDKKIMFPDFILEFKGNRIVHYTGVRPLSFLYYDFTAKGKEEVSFSWTSGTGGAAPIFFELDGKKYKVWIYSAELVIEKVK